MTNEPQPTWLTLVQGLLPSLNQSLVVIVTALVTFTGTLATQRYVLAPKAGVGVIAAADKPAPTDLPITLTNSVLRGLGGKMDELAGVASQCTEEVQALRKELRPAPRPPVRAKPASLAPKS